MNAWVALGVVTLALVSWAPRASTKDRTSTGVRNAEARTAAPHLAGQPLQAVVRTVPGPPMVRIPRSKIQLGSTEDEVVEAAYRCNRDAGAQACDLAMFEDELAGPELDVPSFWMDRREVSVAEYRRCSRSGRCEPLSFGRGGERFDQPDLPATFVSFHQARAYCSFRGARLPTEVEFERAARGPRRRAFPWGGRFHSDAANHGRWGVTETDARDGFEEAAPVESFARGATPEGVLNLAGNVAEWTTSYYGPYGSDKKTTHRVVRGGHYRLPPAWLRGAARLHEPATTQAATLGFRCVRPDPRPSR